MSPCVTVILGGGAERWGHTAVPGKSSQGAEVEGVADMVQGGWKQVPGRS